jgi:hypothetical protein
MSFLLDLFDEIPLLNDLVSEGKKYVNGVTNGVSNAIGTMNDLFEGGGKRERTTPINRPLSNEKLLVFRIGGSKVERKSMGKESKKKLALKNKKVEDGEFVTNLTGTDYLGPVVTGSMVVAGTCLYSSVLSPAHFNNTRTQLFSMLFQQYSVRKFAVRFESAQPATVAGWVTLVFYSDPTKIPVAGDVVDMSTIGAISNQHKVKVYECATVTENLKGELYYVDTDDESASNLRLTHFGAFALFAGDGCPSSIDLGSLFMDYAYSFSGPLSSSSTMVSKVSAFVHPEQVYLGTSFPFSLETFSDNSSTGYFAPDDQYASDIPVTFGSNYIQIVSKSRVLVSIDIVGVIDSLPSDSEIKASVTADIFGGYGTMIYPDSTNSDTAPTGYDYSRLSVTCIVDPDPQGVIRLTGGLSVVYQSGVTGDLTLHSGYLRIVTYPSGYTGMMNNLALKKQLTSFGVTKRLVEKKEIKAVKKPNVLSTDEPLTSNQSNFGQQQVSLKAPSTSVSSLKSKYVVVKS